MIEPNVTAEERDRIPPPPDAGFGVRIVRTAIEISDLEAMATGMFGSFVKAVVDVERAVMALDGEMHADEEAMLLRDGSKQDDLWGINLRPDLIDAPGFIEFDSVINIRPRQGNRRRFVDDEDVRQRIKSIVNGLVGR
jgi:hypothetical protein